MFPGRRCGYFWGQTKFNVMESIMLEYPAEKKRKSTKTKFVYSFHEGDGKNLHLLGGKGANLCEMTQIGLNVPPGFVISTEACLTYLENKNRELPAGVITQV